MRASRRRSHHSLRLPAAGVKRPAHGEAFGLRAPRSAPSTSLARQPERRGERVRRDRTQALEPTAQDLDQRIVARPRRVAAVAAGATIAGLSVASGHSAWNCGRRSAAIQSVAPGLPSQPRHALVARQLREPLAPAGSPGLRLRPSVTKPSQTSASCSSSAFAASGQASSRTRAIASASSRPRSAAVSGRASAGSCTACVRRSSSGASSRNA